MKFSEYYKGLNEGNFGIHIIKKPNGKYGFVGSVPVKWGYTNKDGSEISDKDADSIHQVGPGMIMKSKGIITRAWDSEKEAKDFMNKHKDDLNESNINEAHGDKRDYKKIEFHYDGKYVATTTWAKNLKVAKEEYLKANKDIDPKKLTVSYKED